MSNFLIFNNVHLGLELLGAIIFFIITWLFFEGYLIKRDIFSLGRFLGFLLLSIGQILHSVYSSDLNWLPIIYMLGLLVLILNYGLEKLPPRPTHFAFSPLIFFPHKPVVYLVLNFVLLLILIKKYFKDIEKLLKPLIVGFLFLTLSSLVPLFGNDSAFNLHWILEHALKLVGFLGAGFWAWRLLSLRMREEALLVFIGASLFITLLVTTTFSTIFLKRIEGEVKFNLASSAKIFNFYVESFKNKALAESQIIAQDENFVSAFRAKDIADLEKISKELIAERSLRFLTVAENNGNVLFKLNFPIVSNENILIEKIGKEALEGRVAVTIEESASEGFSIRAGVPIFDREQIIGALIAGYLLDNSFIQDFKNISAFENSIFVGGKVIASSIFNIGDRLDEPHINESIEQGKEFVGTARFFDEEVLGIFSPLTNLDNRVIAMLVLTTTPGELLDEAEATNRLTLFIMFLIVIALIIPLYRFTVFLMS